MIRQRFGTFRGLVRLILAHGQVFVGKAHVKIPDPAQVRRFVFVCQGNICRSAYADVLASGLGADAISFGLSTSGAMPAHPPASIAAGALGVDLADHRTSRVEEYVLKDGDLLLAMEVRQLAALAATPHLAAVPRALLGSWARPPRPHIHDPYQLDDAYMLTCLGVIDTAVRQLIKAYPGAKPSQ